MLPWEREIYIMQLQLFIQEENEKIDQLKNR